MQRIRHFGQEWEKGREQQEADMRLALGEVWASPVSPLLTAGLNGPKAGCAHVCLVPSRAKWHSIAGNKNPALYGRGAGIRAVQAGAGTDVPDTGSLSDGYRQEKKQDFTRRKWK